MAWRSLILQTNAGENHNKPRSHLQTGRLCDQAQLLDEVCIPVTKESMLLPLSGELEIISGKTAC